MLLTPENKPFQCRYKSFNENELSVGIRNRDAHFIFGASKDVNSIAFRILVKYFGFDFNTFERYVNEVVRANDVGCFFPKYFVSLLPQFKLGHVPHATEISRLLTECFKANQYLKCSELHFVFDAEDNWNETEFLELLNNIQYSPGYINQYVEVVSYQFNG